MVLQIVSHPFMGHIVYGTNTFIQQNQLVLGQFAHVDLHVVYHRPHGTQSWLDKQMGLHNPHTNLTWFDQYTLNNLGNIIFCFLNTQYKLFAL